jgi:flagellar hook assembly protein FlgD
VESRESSDGARAGAWLLILLLVLSVAGFAATRIWRSADDIVNTVVISAELDPSGDSAEIRFSTTIEEPDATVYVIDEEEEPVRTLQEGEPLASGEHVFTWDGVDDEGDPVPPARYGLRVVLGEEGRDIVPPGSVLVLEPSFTIERAD